MVGRRASYSHSSLAPAGCSGLPNSLPNLHDILFRILYVMIPPQAREGTLCGGPIQTAQKSLHKKFKPERSHSENGPVELALRFDSHTKLSEFVSPWEGTFSIVPGRGQKK